MYFKSILIVFTVTSFLSLAQQKTPYKLYDTKGKEVSYKKMLRTLTKADVILFGEQHDNTMSHWLEVELLSDLLAQRKMLIGFEMLERDNQDLLDQYIMKKIDTNVFEDSARLWPNFKTDYKPLLDLGRKHKLEVVATNVPRRFAKKVYEYGFRSLDSLTKLEKICLPPLPFPYDASLPAYKQMTKMVPDHSGEYFPKAQAVKDATMGYFISKYYKPNYLFLHFNGAFHSNNYQGICWYLKQYNPNLRVLTISTETVENVYNFQGEFKGLADFIILVDRDVIRTY